ncbi:TatD family hydrolase [Candidatus Bathyarchaeota archaeon]|nr:TatD family hydrolase [Candidatus Bathyarchaeota archaeon]
MDLVDTHAHLEEIEGLDGAIRRAEEKGVIAIITMGMDVKSSLWSLNESRKHQTENLKIYPAIGIHPWNASSINDTEGDLRFIEENVHRIVAIGEIGLDYWYENARENLEVRRRQKEVFRRLLEIAKRYDKPVSIHSRGAWIDCVETVIEMQIRRAVFHWFSGPKESLKRLLDHGYYISATPAASYSKEHRAAIEYTPLENLLLETDSPVNYRGRKAEPADVVKSLSAVAELKGLNELRVAEETTENAKRVFGIM